MPPIWSRLLFAALLVPIALVGQTFEEKVTVTYIEVPVTVIGRDGVPVRNLTKANFALFDEGQQRTIESFESIDFATHAMAAKVSPLNPESRRKFLLLFDLSYSSPITIGRAQKAARDFIARSIGRRDLVAVGTIDTERGFRFLTAFTTDRELLTEAIAEPRNFRAADPLQIAGIDLSPVEQGPRAGTTFEAEDRGAAELAGDLARMDSKSGREYERGRVRRQVDMLGEVARAMQRLAGTKHLVLLSEGFDPRLVQGRSVGESREQEEENRAVSFGEYWKVDSDQRFGNAESQRSLALMADRFRYSNVVLHAVDIQGVRVQNDMRGSVVNSNEGLFLLANSTGGTVFRNSNDISGEFDRLTRQHEVVYILGFRAPVGKPDVFHNLKVKLVDVDAARVHHRGGYYTSGFESALERSLSAAEVIVNDIPQIDIAIAPLVRAFPASADAQVPVVLEISGPDLVRHGSQGRATTDIFVYAFDAEGIARDSAHQRVVLDLSTIGGRLREGGIRFYATLSLPAGSYAVKSLVRIAETDRKGFQRVDLTVAPHGDAVVIAPLFFQDAGEWVMVKATSDDASVQYPFILDGEPFIPATKAALKRGEPRLFALYVYNVAPEELTWEIAPEAKLVSTSHHGGVTTFLFALERVPANTTSLDVTVRKKESAEARTVTVPIFVVE